MRLMHFYLYIIYRIFDIIIVVIFVVTPSNLHQSVLHYRLCGMHNEEW